jgi:hypothetical protein
MMVCVMCCVSDLLHALRDSGDPSFLVKCTYQSGTGAPCGLPSGLLFEVRVRASTLLSNGYADPNSKEMKLAIA